MEHAAETERTRAQEQAKKVLTLGDEEELWGGPSSGRRDAGEGGCGLKRLEARRRNPLLPLWLRRSGTSSNGRGGSGFGFGFGGGEGLCGGGEIDRWGIRVGGGRRSEANRYRQERLTPGEFRH
jgi:hypothetical protein